MKAKLSPSAQAVLQCLADGATLITSSSVDMYCWLVDKDEYPIRVPTVRYVTVEMFLKRGWIKVSRPTQGFPRRTEYKITDDGAAVLAQARA